MSPTTSLPPSTSRVLRAAPPHEGCPKRTGRAPLVVIAGIPGAGKSTALRDLDGTHLPGGARVADVDSIRRRLRTRVPRGLYPLLRPLAHLLHWVRVAVLAFTETRPLLVHDTATRPLPRAGLLRLAKLAHRSSRMVWIDIDPAAARRGQVARGRVVRCAAFRRHLRRIRRCDPAAAASRDWDIVYRTDRKDAAHALMIACRTTAPSTGVECPTAAVSQELGRGLPSVQRSSIGSTGQPSTPR